MSTFEWLQRDEIKTTPYFVGSPLEALEAVSVGHADATIRNLAAATYLIEKNGLANLKIAAPTVYGNYNLSIAIRKDWPELASVFNKGLAAISQEKHQEIRNKWIAVRYEHGIRSIDILKWVLVVSFVSAILLAVFYFSNKKLKKEISERQKVEKLLTQFKLTLDQTLDCVFMFAPDTLIFSYVNQGATNMVGYSMEELMNMTPLDINPEFSEETYRVMLSPLLNKRKLSHTFETLHKHKNGELIPVEIFLQYISPSNEAGRFIAIVRDITERKIAEQNREKLIAELQEATEEVNSLRGILPICSFCKNVRNDEGYYEKIEAYVHKHSEVDFSHTICPDCMRKHYPEECKKIEENRRH